MIDFLYYILQVSIVFSVLYLFYRISFRGLTFHNVNRVFMLLMLPLSMIIPFIDIGVSSDYIFHNESFPNICDDFGSVGNETHHTVITNNTNWNLSTFIVFTYGLGVLTYLSFVIINALKIVEIKRQSLSQTIGSVRIFLADIPLVFSCFKWIFLPLNEKEKIDNLIVEHEKLHGKLWHTLDLILTELYVALFWFTPFVYLFRRDIKTVHEYQVDSMILRSNIKKTDYLQLLLKNLVSSHKVVSLCNYFNGLTIKKRAKMITKENSSKWKLVNYILIIPVVGLMIMSFSSPTDKDSSIPSISPVKVGEYDGTFLIKPIHPVIKKRDKVSCLAFKTKKATKIFATADGVVTNAGYKRGYARSSKDGKALKSSIIVIDHGSGYETWYRSMSDYAVKLGDKVKKGQELGHSWAVNFYFHVYKDGKPVNPQDYIKD